jgi:glycosyltransferase involved in cell wall biosynthesis
MLQPADPPAQRTAAAHDDEQAPLLSVVLPCLDEAAAVGEVVRIAFAALAAEGVDGEVVVADNGSRDGSAALAAAAGARVVHEGARGYGAACRAGLRAARGEWVLLADADLTYDLAQLGRFVRELEQGAEVVMGNRFAGGIRPGAMPLLHRYVGNPVLTLLLNLRFRSGVRDAHCGMRAFRRDLLPALDLRADGMEFASEHVVRSAQLGLDVRQVAIGYFPRRGASKLATLRDGWRHLRYLLGPHPVR